MDSQDINACKYTDNISIINSFYYKDNNWYIEDGIGGKESTNGTW